MTMNHCPGQSSLEHFCKSSLELKIYNTTPLHRLILALIDLTHNFGRENLIYLRLLYSFRIFREVIFNRSYLPNVEGIQIVTIRCAFMDTLDSTKEEFNLEFARLKELYSRGIIYGRKSYFQNVITRRIK